ncbi:iron ABC transporter substrate-binding protein [Candidatus Viridilinea mediisalina]|uniref:Iron ABC transporter substrate-binding protein n=1 Tax=Candidatus Viridilinea mediisalina TaxID=2024553 RepID=A0A2A6RLU0_9CHLR|nr:iron ABC transporter substrate-binding protein [Candidatus Viridilinea mediisalina]PDW03839.1 iron ABC transporter substrate-binding protein [Candidatus Viridilinea mediisalina]
MLRYPRSVVVTAMLAVLVFLLTACGEAAAPAAPAPSPEVIRETVEVPVTAEPEVVQEFIEVTADPGSLVIYSGRSEALVGPLIKQFADATGIDVQVRYGSTSEIAATILEEGAASPADIFFAQDPGGLGAIANAGLFAPLPADLMSQAPERFRSPRDLWIGVSGRARIVVYNTDAVDPADLPADIFDLTDPQWAGRIGWAPANGSFQAMVSAMRVVWGDAKTVEWLQGIQANDPIVFDRNVPIVEAVGAGEVDIGLTNHYYLYRFLREQGEGFKARNHFLSGGGPGSLILIAGAGRLASGPNEANALRFMQFLLSDPAQQYFASRTSEYPLVEDIVTPAGLPPLEELETAALAIDMAELEDLQGTIELIRQAGVLP